MKKLTIVQIYDFPETIYGRHWEHRAHNILIITVTPYNINKIVLCRLSLVLDVPYCTCIMAYKMCKFKKNIKQTQNERYCGTYFYWNNIWHNFQYRYCIFSYPAAVVTCGENQASFLQYINVNFYSALQIFMFSYDSTWSSYKIYLYS